MQTLHQLITDRNKQAWLDNVIIILDPCENPDGRDRYVNWYNQVVHSPQNPHTVADEHSQPWPGGRYNHYLFDLNRDWLWQTQIETQQRIKVYQQWMPHVHVDLHEMGINSPYFFAPAARPIHDAITEWQYEFQEHVGHNHAGHFNREGWLYFTKEVFDLFYPSYGDTWPTFNGAIGFTYEQGGSRRAGLAVITATGDTLTLKDRLEHHYTTSLSTIETAYTHRERLLTEFKRYFSDGMKSPVGKHKAYVIKGDNDAARLSALLDLLDKQQIHYGTPTQSGKSYTGHDYMNNKKSQFTLSSSDIVVSAYQPMSRMVQVLFEPTYDLTDSLTYDVTAWALPYIYEVEAYAVETKIENNTPAPKSATVRNAPSSKRPYAYIAKWKDVQDAKLLAALLKENVNVRYATQAFELSGESFDRGSLVITRADNKALGARLDNLVLNAANQLKRKLHYATTGFSDQGPDLGSGSFVYIENTKVALVRGDGISPSEFGHIWYYFEQDLNYPVTVLNTSYLNSTDLSQFDVLVLASGGYSSAKEKLSEFVRNGGRIIAIEGAIRNFTSDGKTLLGQAIKEQREKKPSIKNTQGQLNRFEDQEKQYISRSVQGSIYRVHLDDSHPLAFGDDSVIHLMKRNSTPYPYLPPGGWNVGVFKSDSYVSGFTGSQLKPKLVNTLAIGVEQHGSGQLVYFVDSPVFRGFWHSGKLLLANAVFF